VLPGQQLLKSLLYTAAGEIEVPKSEPNARAGLLAFPFAQGLQLLEVQLAVPGRVDAGSAAAQGERSRHGTHHAQSSLTHHAQSSSTSSTSAANRSSKNGRGSSKIGDDVKLCYKPASHTTHAGGEGQQHCSLGTQPQMLLLLCPPPPPAAAAAAAVLRAQAGQFHICTPTAALAASIQQRCHEEYSVQRSSCMVR